MRFDTTIIDLRRAGITLGWVLFVALFVIVDVAQAHGGGLNKSGCHNNRKTGDYHCHRSSYTPRSSFTSSVPRTQLTNPSSSSNRAIEDDKIFGVQVVLKKNHC